MDGLKSRIGHFRRLTKFQQAALALEERLGCDLNLDQFSQYLGEELGIHKSRAYNWLLHNPQAFTESALEKVINDTELIRKGQKRELAVRLRSRYIPIDDYPDLEKCVKRLMFRNKTAMIKAVSEKTGVPLSTLRRHLRTYDTEVMYGRREVKECLEEWLRLEKQGKSLRIKPKYRKARFDGIRRISDFLVAIGKYETKKQMAKELSPEIGLSHVTLEEKYFSSNKTSGNARFEVYECLKSMFRQYNPREEYLPGELVFNRLKKDFGMVTSVNGKTMEVQWEKCGKLTMAQNDPY